MSMVKYFISEYVGTAELKQNSSSEASEFDSVIGAPTTPATKRVDLAAVVGRIRHHVLVNSLRVFIDNNLYLHHVKFYCRFHYNLPYARLRSLKSICQKNVD